MKSGYVCERFLEIRGGRYLELYGRPRNVVTAGRDRSRHRPDRELGPGVMFTILKVFHDSTLPLADDMKGRKRAAESLESIRVGVGQTGSRIIWVEDKVSRRENIVVTVYCKAL